MAKATLQPIGEALKRTYRAEGGALTRGTGVMFGTAEDQVKAPTGATVLAAGVVDETADAAAKPVVIVTHGETIGIAGGAVNPGDYVKIGGTNGRMIATTTHGDPIVGRAVGAAAADGDEFVVFVNPGFRGSGTT